MLVDLILSFEDELYKKLLLQAWLHLGNYESSDKLSSKNDLRYDIHGKENLMSKSNNTN